MEGFKKAVHAYAGILYAFILHNMFIFYFTDNFFIFILLNNHLPAFDEHTFKTSNKISANISMF